MTTQAAKSSSSVPAKLRAFEARHIAGALLLSQEMGWPYRREDWDIAAQLGQGVVLERAGKVIGTALWWGYGQSFATAGMIIVTASEQGSGYGSKLFDALLQATGERSVLLNATEEGLALYQRRGFTRWGTVLQHQGLLGARAEAPDREDIRPASMADLPAIEQLDARAAGMNRAQMLAALAGMGKVAVIDRAGQILGYSIARQFGRGHVVGPVVAGTADDARALILAQLGALQGQFVRIDVYAKDGLGDWLTDLGLPETGRAVAMVKGQLPVTDTEHRVFALANQSFG
ncbi:GNAT family N-acetyltransferase [Pseudotabrizicola sp. 4114]|uniref:GNAT family N-acetyltransferase n=1 Tax=Pseudotabrizicola sp. 4114 TaxID=2817731 RepID=UPI00285E7E1F|nr:GNAT superfamily N-acetyltransferase [Pseudorhodobacter sp. 4114]